MNNKKIILYVLLIIFAVFSFFLSKKINLLKTNEQTDFFLKEAKIREENFYEDEDYKNKIKEELKDKIQITAKEEKEKPKEKIIEKKEERLYYLQVGTFKNKANAENLLENLSDIAKLKIEKSKYNDSYYILLTEDYNKKKLADIDLKIKERFETINPIVKVRY